MQIQLIKPAELFRSEGSYFVFSMKPGGEGRMVNKNEAADIILLLEQSEKIQNRRLWVSLGISTALAFLGGWYAISFRLPMLFVISACLPGIVAIPAILVFFTKRWKARQQAWKMYERRPPVRRLSGSELVARGYRMSWKMWLGLSPFFAVFFLAKIHASPGETLWGFDLYWGHLWAVRLVLGLCFLFFGSVLAHALVVRIIGIERLRKVFRRLPS